MDEIIEKISNMIKDEFNHSVCAGNLDTELVARQIFYWLLNTGRLNLDIPEAASGCCEINE